MSWLAIVLWLITNIPTIIKLIEELIALIKGQPHAVQNAYRVKISDAIKTGDHELVKQTVHECLGAACPTDLKTE